MNKKMLPVIIGVIVLLIIAGGAFAFYTFKSKSNAAPVEEQKKKRAAEPLNVIPVAERPYMYISPESDGHNVTLTIARVNKAASQVEYELEYQAGSLLQGAFGELDVSSLPTSKKVLLGSCSAGGACTYHEDVKGGTLLTRFSGTENYALKSEWRYIDNKAKETLFASKDQKFQLDSTDLKSTRFLVIFNSAGYPEGLSGTPVSDPYSLQAAGGVKGKGKLTMRAAEEGTLEIMGYDGKSWKSFTTAVDGKMATATVDLMELYIVVRK